MIPLMGRCEKKNRITWLWWFCIPRRTARVRAIPSLDMDQECVDAGEV